MNATAQTGRKIRCSLPRHNSAGFVAIDVRIQNHLAHIFVSGSFDYYAHCDFKKSYMPLLDNPDINEIRVEISKVVYLDIPALGMLLLLNERASAVHKRVTLITSSGAASQMLAVANFSRIFNIHHLKAEHCGLPAIRPSIGMYTPRITSQY